MRQHPMMALLLLYFVILSAGCARQPPRVLTNVELVKFLPPEELLWCADEPEIYEPDLQTEASDLTARIAYAGRDCRSKVRDTREWAQRLRESIGGLSADGCGNDALCSP